MRGVLACCGVACMLVGFLLFTLYRTQQFRAQMTLRKRVIRVEGALGRLPRNSSRRNALLRGNQDLLLLHDRGVELVKKFLVIAPARGRESLLHQYLKAGTVVIPVLQ